MEHMRRRGPARRCRIGGKPRREHHDRSASSMAGGGSRWGPRGRGWPPAALAQHPARASIALPCGTRGEGRGGRGGLPPPCQGPATARRSGSGSGRADERGERGREEEARYFGKRLEREAEAWYIFVCPDADEKPEKPKRSKREAAEGK